ncbi:MAG: MFS transporter [Spirochaetota bacterium]|nr:MFS transporter [Spirochaetota bacterium]
MLFRFSLYGFLKNQKYFEPVFYLILLQEKGLTFTMLGILIGFGGICVNLFEIPSGALADIWGRRKCMIFSFISYISSFILYYISQQIWLLFFAMILFSIGEAFRTGTHKAMIFDWLRMHERLDEKTMIYGYTRSWSKIGSSLSALIGVAFMLSWRSLNPKAEYSHVFLLCIVPYSIAIINLLGYPKELDGERKRASLKIVLHHLFNTIKDAIKISQLRRLFIESMSFEGTFKAVKDYVQPITYLMVMSLPVIIIFTEMEQLTTLVIYGIYFIMDSIASIASRYSYRFSFIVGGEERGCRFIWWMTLMLFIIMAPLLYYKIYLGVISAFIVFHFLQNVWRPMLISRFDTYSRPESGATILSIESQAKSFYILIAAPLLGFVIDYTNSGGFEKNFWPIAAMGIVISLLMITTSLKMQRT